MLISRHLRKDSVSFLPDPLRKPFPTPYDDDGFTLNVDLFAAVASLLICHHHHHDHHRHEHPNNEQRTQEPHKRYYTTGRAREVRAAATSVVSWAEGGGHGADRAAGWTRARSHG